MTRITFARHAESELNLTPEFIVGRSNHARLTERGLYQASLLGAYFRENGIVFDAIYSSGAVRADQTAQGVIDAAGYDLPVLTDERFQEVSQGPWEGKHRDDVYTEEIIRMHRLHALDGSLPGAQSIASSQVDMAAAVRDLEISYPSGNLLVVAHGLSIRGLVGKVRRQSKAEILEASTPNVSLTDISVRDGIILAGQVGKIVISE